MLTVSKTPSKIGLGDGPGTPQVVVAMSGGVDSCASALLLTEQGYSIIGVAMQVWDYRKNGGNATRATCCAPSDFDDARGIAEACDFPFYVFDFEDSFYDAVIQPFIEAYQSGQTPNPCLDCNRKVKFRQLRDRARTLGVTTVATGHYAQVKNLSDGKKGLFTAVDTEKDQSYFLYALTQEDLKSTLFPVGAMKKPEVRAYLESHGFKVARKAESQDICFVGSTVSDFIEKQTGKSMPAGIIISPSGEQLGRHNGIYGFTVGQRRGLGISDARPLYVLDIDAETNTVTVGPKEELERTHFYVQDVNWIAGDVPQNKIRAKVKLRYRHPGVLCEVSALDEHSAKVTFLDEWTSVSPGQAAVFYAEFPDEEGSTEVIGGGRIVKGTLEEVVRES